MQLVAGDTDCTLIVACVMDPPSGECHGFKTAIDLTGATVYLFWRMSHSSASYKRVMTLTATPTDGMASYQFLAGELTAGDLVYEVEVDLPDNSVITQSMPGSIQVRERIYGRSRPA